MLARILDPTDPLGAAALGMLLFAIATLLGLSIRQALKRLEPWLSDLTALRFIGALAQVLVYVFALVIWAHLVPALRAMGTALLTGVSVVSVVTGIAAQGTLGNLVAGFWLVLSRSIHVGDKVRVASEVGVIVARVHSIALGSTILLDEEGHEVTVPNSVLMASAITQLAHAPHPRHKHGGSDATAPGDPSGGGRDGGGGGGR